MKKIMISFAALAAISLLASCTKEEPAQKEPCGCPARVRVAVSTPFETKATGVSDDASDTKKVNSIQVFAFDADGILRGYEGDQAASSVTLQLNTGEEYTFYAVVNNAASGGWKYPSVASVTAASELGAIMTDLSKNSTDDLLMFSQQGVKKTITASVSEVSIDVTRLVSKVQLKKVAVDFSSNAVLKRKSLKIDSIYVINAAMQETFGLSPAASVSYYNPRKYVSGDGNALLCDALASPFEISTSSGTAVDYTTAHTFFAYGNAAAGDDVTRLVVSCNWGGKRTYYPINIVGSDSKLSPNCAYVVNQLTIKGLGSDDPNVVPERKSFSASVTIRNWETGFEKTVDL